MEKLFRLPNFRFATDAYSIMPYFGVKFKYMKSLCGHLKLKI